MPQNIPHHPSHIIYHVKDTNQLDAKGRRKGIWTRIGALWPTQSGNGSRIQLDYTPAIDGRMYMLEYPAREDEKQDITPPWRYEDEEPLA